MNILKRFETVKKFNKAGPSRPRPGRIVHGNARFELYVLGAGEVASQADIIHAHLPEY